MSDVKARILESLKELGLDSLPARPFDCAFDVVAAPPAEKRLVVVGLNGSMADAENGWTNARAVEEDAQNPTDSELRRGLDGLWTTGNKRGEGPPNSKAPRKFTTLAKRLEQLPGQLGFESGATVYTNSLLLCSKGADDIASAAQRSSIGSYEALRVRSMKFFEGVTLSISEPELIVAYSNSIGPFSATQILYEAFGRGGLRHYSRTEKPVTWGFLAQAAGRRIPVVGIRHLSRFKPKLGEVEDVREQLRRAG